MTSIRRLFALALLISASLLHSAAAHAQDTHYFVTYSHHLEEPGSLEVELYSNYGTQKAGNDFIAPWVEIEYGTTGWWTTEFYLDTQSTFHDSTVFTGFRWENRFRPLMREHWINPVLYVEYENITDADKTLKEVVGFDNQFDFSERNSVLNHSYAHEIEAKLILSSDYKGWNISENFIAEKNLGHAPWEFGYALGASRPLRLEGGVRSSAFALQNFACGAEMYGGLGDTDALSLHETSHYFGPSINWSIPRGPTITASPNFGLNGHSVDHLYRFEAAYEIGQIARFFGRGVR